MKTTVSSFALLSILLIGTVSSTEVDPCTSGASLPEVEIEGCAASPCVVYLNASAVMTMKFKSPRNLEHIAPQAQAYVAGIEISYPLGQTDACQGITNTGCPLSQGQDVEYSFGLFILPIFPKIQVEVEFSLVDEDEGSEAFECFRMDLQITD